MCSWRYTHNCMYRNQEELYEHGSWLSNRSIAKKYLQSEHKLVGAATRKLIISTNYRHQTGQQILHSLLAMSSDKITDEAFNLK